MDQEHAAVDCAGETFNGAAFPFTVFLFCRKVYIHFLSLS